MSRASANQAGSPAHSRTATSALSSRPVPEEVCGPTLLYRPAGRLGWRGNPGPPQGYKGPETTGFTQTAIHRIQRS
eukprot:8316150-Karenia_brevis.AAC.1